MSVKIAGAPISWGVCEVPGWGYQLEPERVLGEMSELGLTATEFGPVGFLPEAGEARAELLQRLGMKVIGGFFPILLHDAEFDPLPDVVQELVGYVASGADVLVLAASTGLVGYDDARPVLTDQHWARMFENLDRIAAYAAEHSVTAVIHPHVGTMVETQGDVDKVLAGSKIPFCLDTGHMLIGGTDPVAFSKEHGSRIRHSHLKDVNLAVALRVRDGEITYSQGVRAGLYTPLGQGDVDVGAIIKNMLLAGYTGWFALEQDYIIDSDPGAKLGPFQDAKASVEFINSVVAEVV
jgi:inosose dehydratase